MPHRLPQVAFAPDEQAAAELGKIWAGGKQALRMLVDHEKVAAKDVRPFVRAALAEIADDARLRLGNASALELFEEIVGRMRRSP